MTDAQTRPVVRPRLAAVLLGLVAVAGLGVLAATGHDRVVTVLALAALLAGVLNAAARVSS